MSWTYPWTMHLKLTDFRAYADDLKIFSTGPEKADKVLVRVGKGSTKIPIAKLEAARAALSAIHNLSLGYDLVATFALGGWLPLYFLASRLGCYDQNQTNGKHLHMFPGLAWGAKPDIRDKPFLEFLQALPKDKSLLIFDVGSVGHGVISASKHIRNLWKQKKLDGDPRIMLLGIVDGTYKKQATAVDDLAKAKEKYGKSNVDLAFIHSEIRAVDDACQLQGYIQMRIEAKLQPYANIGSISLIAEDGTTLLGAGTANSAQLFGEVVVKGPSHLNPNRFLGQGRKH